MRPTGSFPDMQRRSLLTRTRQMWKLHVVALSWVVATALCLAEIALARVEPRWIVDTLPTIAAFLGLFVAWGVLTVRCPSCGTRLLWKAALEQRPGSWWLWLSSLQTCPVCGAVGDEQHGARSSPTLVSLQPRTRYGWLTSAGIGFLLAFSVAAGTMLVGAFILSVSDVEALARSRSRSLIALEVLPWILGSTAGGFVTSQIAIRGRQAAAVLAGALLLLGVAILWASDSRPLWQWLVAPVVVVLPAAFGGFLGSRRAEGA